MDKQELYLVPVPAATASYAPVSHRNIIEASREQLYKHGLDVTDETLKVARDGMQMIGYMDLKYDSNEEIGLRLAFRNSYDKSMSVAFVSGANVWICSNGMIGGEIQFLRKHTGSVVKDLNIKIEDTINQLDAHYRRMMEHSNKMKEIELANKCMAELAGRMFIEEDLISATQLSEVKRQINKPAYEDFDEQTLWSFYNHLTYSLKSSHPTTYIQQHKNLHEFVSEEFSLL